MSDVSTMNHGLMCECGHVSGGHYYNPSLSGFDRCINCKCKQFRLSCFEPTQTSPERAELQVSLLNEIGLTLTLTAMAKEQVAQGVSMVTAFASYTQRLQNIADDRDRDHQLYRQMDERIQGLGLSMAGDYTSLAQKIFDLAETQAAQRKSLEGIQGLLVEIDAKTDKLATNELLDYAHRANGHDFQALNERLRLIETVVADTAKRVQGIEAHLSERPVTVKRKPSLRPVSRKKRKR